MGLLDFLRTKPPAKPRAHSGRSHTNGFLDYDERNVRLVGSEGIRKFDEMWRTDADVRKSWLMCINPIAGATWEVDPAGGEDATAEDEKIAEFVLWNLTEFMAPKLGAHLWEMLRVLRSGFVPFEQIYARAEWDGRDVLALKRLGLMLPRYVDRFIDEAGELRGIQMQTVGRDGLPGDPEVSFPDLVYYRIGAEGDNWEGESPLRPAYKHWKYKNALELVDAIAHEKFAVGVPIGYPPKNPGDGALDELEEALAGIRANEQGHITMPGPHAEWAEPGEGWLVEILQPERAHDLTNSLKYHSDRIAASVLAEFMRLGQETVGARATADVQQDPFLDYCEAIATVVVEDTINEQLIPRMVALNFPAATDVPKIRCSLIDSTSLTELAEYASKLAAVIHPDDPLEDYLRDRADLPPADPDQREERKAQAEEMREAEMNAKGQEDGGSGGTNSDLGGKKPQQLARSARALRPWEERMELDRIEASLDAAREAFVAGAREVTVPLAERYASLALRGRKRPQGPDPDLVAVISDQLYDLYATGRDTVRSELEEQARPTFSLAAADEGAPERLEAQARVSSEAVQAAVWTEVQRAALGTDDVAAVRQAGEAAARGALRAEALQAAAPALNAGRQDEAEAHSEAIRGAYYTSVLDGQRCAACAAADDDVLRTLDDPVRLANLPPNRSCFGGGRCRCMEAFQLKEESPPSI